MPAEMNWSSEWAQKDSVVKRQQQRGVSLTSRNTMQNKWKEYSKCGVVYFFILLMCHIPRSDFSY